MMTENHGMQLKLVNPNITIEDFVPQNHLLRKIEAAVDFSFVYDEMREYYCPNNGRPSTDPVQLVKYLLIGFLYNINSEREIEIEIQGSMPYRWFMGLNFDDKVPNHSTISQNRRRRFNGTNVYRRMFERILTICIEKGLVDGKVILTDSTHVRANASRQSEIKVVVEKEAAYYMGRLDKYEAAEREKLESEGKIMPKKPGDKQDAPPKLIERRVSTTDPDAGFLKRPGKPLGMHYLDHQSIDAKKGIIVDVTVTRGNVSDVAPYLDRIDYIRENIGLQVEAVGVDSVYDVGLVHQELSDKNIEVYTPKLKEEFNYKSEFTRLDFQYNQEDDEFICPAGNALPLKRLQRIEGNVSRIYEMKTRTCSRCSLREKCLSPGRTQRQIAVSIFDAAFRRNHEKDETPEHKRILDLRQIWCEGTFAAQKARHNLRFLYRRGLEAAEEHCLMAAMAINLKRLVKSMG
ncbi:MAG: IS1182 family transposase [Clostridiales bacterium]|nr:IS1182 family transposase [Clostridiales bacterium]